MVKMAKRRGRKGRRSAMSRRPHIPMAIALPAIADGMYMINVAKDGLSSGELTNLAYQYAGWTGSGVDVGQLVKTYGKYVVGAGVHIVATKTGVNKQISKLTRGYVVI